MIVFVSNFLNHHQFPVAEQLYKFTNGNYRFVELEQMPQSFKAGGYPEYQNAPFLVKGWQDKDIAEELIATADVVLYGSISDYTSIRRRLKNRLLTFEVGERWLKRGWINILSPRLLKSQWLYHTEFYNKPLYRLCSSAYAANDLYAMHSFRGKCFKWGYFTNVEPIDVDEVIEQRRHNECVKLMAVARFLPLKHHELSVMCAKNLRDKGIDFKLDIYGSGPEFDNIQALVSQFGLDDYVFLKGNLPNEELLLEMRKHDIFLFTSDRHEGWGAVVNEAMANACPVVGSDAVGAVPFLISNQENGMIFKSGDLDDLTGKVAALIADRPMLERLAKNAYKTISEVWSPRNAAENLLELIDALRKGEQSNIDFGPCSPALPIQSAV